MPTILVVFLIGLLGASIVIAAEPADESSIQLREGPARELVEANCSACHSLDYIVMNSVFLDRKGWQAEVTKMVKVNGAEIADEEQAKILDYLVDAYGTQL
ncbi:MAG: hypothetical protein KF815_03655 [Rhodospirillales bacterium]|nr:hypothetical protein [Rhodospirillales bacterium]